MLIELQVNAVNSERIRDLYWVVKHLRMTGWLNADASLNRPHTLVTFDVLNFTGWLNDLAP